MREEHDFSGNDADRIIARTLSRWATSYRASPVGNNAPVRVGDVAGNRVQRAALIDELFDWEQEWLQSQPIVMTAFVGLLLYEGDSLLLDQHDGVPAAHLWLRPRQFNDLQIALERAGLPRDLYFPLRDLRIVTGPVQRFGAEVLGDTGFSPREWERLARLY